MPGVLISSDVLRRRVAQGAEALERMRAQLKATDIETRSAVRKEAEQEEYARRVEILAYLADSIDTAEELTGQCPTQLVLSDEEASLLGLLLA